MADIKNDPLVQFLTKQASMVKKQLRGEIEEGRMNDMVQKGNQEVSDTLKALFQNRTDKAKL